MRRLIAGIVLLLAAGCGGDGNDDPLANTAWELHGGSCSFGLAFGAADYSAIMLCSLTDGTYGLEREDGTYFVEGSRLITAATQSTCRDVQKHDSLAFSVNANSLTLTTATGVIVLTRATLSGGSGGAAAFGCYDSDGTFTPQPLAPVP